MIELILFTLTGIVLYIAADRILAHMERVRGKVFEYRQVVFFVIILTMAMVVFPLLGKLGST